MFTRAVMLIALVLFVVFYVLKLTGNFHHTFNGAEVEWEWIWVFSPLLFGQAILWAMSIRI